MSAAPAKGAAGPPLRGLPQTLDRISKALLMAGYTWTITATPTHAGQTEPYGAVVALRPDAISHRTKHYGATPAEALRKAALAVAGPQPPVRLLRSVTDASNDDA